MQQYSELSVFMLHEFQFKHLTQFDAVKANDVLCELKYAVGKIKLKVVN